MKAALDFIRGYMAGSNGVAPTYDEIREALGLASKGGVNRLLNELQERGFLTFTANRPRSIQLVAGPSRETMETWSDEEVVRVHGIAFDILHTRCVKLAVSA
jgi:repressor LexA